MKLEEVVNQTGMKVESAQEKLDREVSGGYASDLLSDVMANSREGDVWVTLQVHPNIIAVATLKDLAAVGCRILTLGQYLQPSKTHLPVERFASPEEFEQWRKIALKMGFSEVASGPFVRSSYHAKELYQAVGPIILKHHSAGRTAQFSDPQEEST